MSEGGVSYLNTVAKLMQNCGYVYSFFLDFTDNSINDFILSELLINHQHTHMRLFGVDLCTPIKATENHSIVKPVLLNPKHLGGLHSTNSKNLKIMEV
jgi:hypothetical protein